MSGTVTVDQVIAERLARAAQLLKKVMVPKRGWNGHGQYHYATADDVFEAVRPVLAEVGLVPMMDEEAVEHVDRFGRPWLSIRYRCWWESDFGRGTPFSRTQLVPLLGPQSLAAAATYALKYWLRGALLLATGDQDLDHAEHQQDTQQDTRQDTRPAPRKARKPPKKAAVMEWHTDPETGHVTMGNCEGEPEPDDVSRSLWRYLRDTIKSLPPGAVSDFLAANKEHLQRLPEQGRAQLGELAAKRKEAEE